MKDPFVVKEDKNYIVMYKPAKIHCAPLKIGEAGTLLDFCSRLFPEVLFPEGKKKIEGGLIHRLDFETEGLVLFARNQKSMNHFLQQQDDGKFFKQYEARVSKQDNVLEGFPPPPEREHPLAEIKSAFRSYGPGRKEVRPVSTSYIPKHANIVFDSGSDGLYVTRILEWNQEADNTILVKAELFRGFRHQIRSHLAWIGFPILNDPLYGGGEVLGNGLFLKAISLSFTDPESGEPVEVSL
jgi:23S rRNA pseudouridine1911/1915/1917 synthase